MTRVTRRILLLLSSLCLMSEVSGMDENERQKILNNPHAYAAQLGILGSPRKTEAFVNSITNGKPIPLFKDKPDEVIHPSPKILNNSPKPELIIEEKLNITPEDEPVINVDRAFNIDDYNDYTYDDTEDNLIDMIKKVDQKYFKFIESMEALASKVFNNEEKK